MFSANIYYLLCILARHNALTPTGMAVFVRFVVAVFLQRSCPIMNYVPGIRCTYPLNRLHARILITIVVWEPLDYRYSARTCLYMYILWPWPRCRSASRAFVGAGRTKGNVIFYRQISHETSMECFSPLEIKFSKCFPKTDKNQKWMSQK